ncbi:MAG TPA: CDP-archaeol synthase [Desulfobacteraceae bacterium]|nr:CDP-archaeol synthase [Desulfobacteraceae bacterium]
MHIVLQLTAFVVWVNLLPPLASLIWKDRFDRPLDGGKVWFDGRPVFGPHKTVRGILTSILGGMAVFPLLNVPWWAAGIGALLAMAGDLLSSFIKRRFSLGSGSNVVVLDQFFEAFFPTCFFAAYLDLALWQLLAVLVCFIPFALLGAAIWSFITYRPSPKNCPRLVRSTVRFRAWRSCHVPLARWQVLFNLTSFLSYRILYYWIFRVAGLRKKGIRNALDIQVVEETFRFPDLPEQFDGFRILLLTDLHLDGQPGLTARIVSHIRSLDVDLCLIGGDIRMETYGPMAPCLRNLRCLLPHVGSRHGILGVLGNHDCIEMSPDFEETGLIMLINEAWDIHQNGAQIWIAGVDDPHYYKVHDVRQALRNVPADEFKILLAHSPEAYREAADFQVQLYLCGHTHGGQICLPGRGPIFTNSRAPRFTASGRWRHRGMVGYTSRGVGASGVPLRFNCPGEISLITLRRGTDLSGESR